MTVQRDHAGGARPTTLSGSLSNSATTFTVTTGGGAGYPDGSNGAFVVTVDAGLAGEEKILCAARSGDSFTVTTRGYDGTTATAHSNLAIVDHTFSAVEAQELNDHIRATTGVHGIADTGALATNAAVAAAIAAITVPALPLTQAQSHASPDTDAATSSLHHTIGTGPTQAAAGNHTHAGSSSALLALVQYAPASAASYSPHATARTLQAVDATNLTVSFVAPSSGIVLVRLTGLLNFAAANESVMWGLATHGGTTLVAPVALAAVINSSGLSDRRDASVDIRVSGLTSGNTYNLDWVWASNVTSSTGLIVAQGYQTQVGAVLSAVPTGAPAVISVWSA